MTPSLQPGQPLLVNRTAFWFGRPARGDLVVFDSPTTPGQEFVKRIIGLPGDSVLVTAGHVELNGQALEEPYVRFQANYTYPSTGQPFQVPDDAYFVLGDNRPESADSHLGWLVPASHLIGKPLALGTFSQPGGVDTPMPAPSSAAPVAVPAPLSSARSLDLGQAAAQWDHGHIATDQVGWLLTRQAPLPVAVRDAVVSATFRKVGGAPGGSSGLILRSNGPTEYYTFEVHDDGKVAAWRRAGDSWFELLPATNAEAVRPGASANRLTARLVGDQLELLVNDVQVARLTDATLPQGGAGVLVEGQANAVEFQHFWVQPL